MFAQNVAIVALSALSVVSATSSNWTSMIDVNKIDVGRRNGWCQAQQNACDQLCNPSSKSTCDFTTLNYECTCADGSDPKLSQYLNTIDTFTCEEAYSVCNLANVGSKTGQDNCTTTIKNNCGTKDPAKKEAGGSGSAKSSSASASPTATGGSSSASQSPQASKDAGKSAGASLAAISYLGNGAAALAIAAFAYMI
ncbi:hypothetical protein PG990_006500 [Apiospora arundinis]|uniref:DUF7707 domain-containing protein n=1 Tax=Apiospora arundinis TaxID=335852 RepID=A0ABR2JAA9_9PEZI